MCQLHIGFLICFAILTASSLEMATLSFPTSPLRIAATWSLFIQPTRRKTVTSSRIIQMAISQCMILKTGEYLRVFISLQQLYLFHKLRLWPNLGNKNGQEEG